MKLAVNGVRYHVEAGGSGSPMLLLHGFTGSLSSWDAFVEKWGREHRGIRVDLLGHGQTDAPEESARYAVEQAVRDLEGILDVLEVPQAHVLGYSMGGRLALSFAVLRPRRVRSLILESSSPGLADPEERRRRRLRDEALADRIESEGIRAFVEEWERLPLFATQQRLPRDIRDRIRRQRLGQRERGLANSLRGMGTGVQPSWWDRLTRVTCPVLLITGELDAKFCGIAEKMAGRFPDAEWEKVPGAGHTVHVERPALFDTIVMDFIRRKDLSDSNSG